MESKIMSLVRWRSIRSIIAVICLVALYVSYAGPQMTAAATPIPGKGDQVEGVQIASNDDITLQADAGEPPVPMGDGSFTRFGMYLSPIHEFSTPGTRVNVSYDATTPAGTAVQLDVRASADGERWTLWEIDLTDGAMVDFPVPANIVQYRARLYGNAGVNPTLHTVELRAVIDHNRVHAAPAADAIAPTYRVHATREGLVGYRTANGHIIQPRDHFVSLPSWRSLSSRGGHEYQVRITYQGRSAVAPVWDVGPWNTRDDYWNVEREVWKDLPRGWPQDHAAYFDGHNGGFAEHGYVRFPTAIDVGDGVWWDELNIRGDRAEVEVTFLWLGRDPLEVPPPSSDPDAAEYMVNELGPAFHPNESKSLHSSAGDWECGTDGHTYWSVTTTDEDLSDTEVFWNPDLPISGEFDVYAHIPHSCDNEYRDTREAHYLIQYEDGAKTVIVDQAEDKGWVHLGRFPFAAGDDGFVQLSDLTGDDAHAIWFDNIKWVPVRN